MLGYPEAVDAIIRTFRGYLVGQDPRQIERHWQHLYRMGPFRGSVLSGAVSAVDIALWDIKGQILQARSGSYLEESTETACVCTC